MTKEELEHKIRSAKLSLGDDFGDEQMMEEAIFKAGIKEVVMWVSANAAEDFDGVGDIIVILAAAQWLAKQGEWGIK